MLTPTTLQRIAFDLMAIEAEIDDMESFVPHDCLPPEYDTLIKRRDAGRALLNQAA